MPLYCMLLLFCALLAGCGPTPQALQPKTLLVGMDGVQLSEYEKLGEASNLKRLHYRKAFTGGITGSGSEQQTVSGPGWMTLLTGVWANKHGVTSNALDLRVSPAYPSLFKQLRQALPNAYLASVVNWSPINTAFLLEDAQGSNVRESGLSDEQVTVRALEILGKTPADFTFIQLDLPDAAGHEHGFGPEYQQALRDVDARLGRLLDSVAERRERYPQEDWLVMVSTDHGREPSGVGHGGQTEGERSIFIASNKPLNEALPAQTSVAPIVLHHMGVDPLPSRGSKADH